MATLTALAPAGEPPTPREGWSLIPCLEIDASQAQDAVHAYSEMLDVPIESLECVPLATGEKCICLLKRPTPDAPATSNATPTVPLDIEDIEAIVKENRELRSQLERSSESLEALLQHARCDAAALEEARAQARAWQQRYEEERSDRRPGAPPGVVTTPKRGDRTGTTSTTPRVVGGGVPDLRHLAGCRACGCAGYAPRSETSWLCECGHTSVKHLASGKTGGSPRTPTGSASGGGGSNNTPQPPPPPPC